VAVWALKKHDIYRNLELTNFSRDILQRAVEKALILEMADVDWSDWGRPARIEASLARFGKHPPFHVNYQQPVLA
jgi:hypothetical protein